MGQCRSIRNRFRRFLTVANLYGLQKYPAAHLLSPASDDHFSKKEILEIRKSGKEPPLSPEKVLWGFDPQRALPRGYADNSPELVIQK